MIPPASALDRIPDAPLLRALLARRAAPLPAGHSNPARASVRQMRISTLPGPTRRRQIRAEVSVDQSKRVGTTVCGELVPAPAALPKERRSREEKSSSSMSFPCAASEARPRKSAHRGGSDCPRRANIPE